MERSLEYPHLPRLLEPEDEIGRLIDHLLATPPYVLPPKERHSLLLELLKCELEHVCSVSPALRNYYRSWPVDIRSSGAIADLPYLPVASLKSQPPLSLVEPHAVRRVLSSSATTGQVPSRVVLDSSTARRMTKGVVAIAQDFIGSVRRPYLVLDAAPARPGDADLGARGAAIRGLQPFASDITYCLEPAPDGGLTLQREKLLQFAEDRHNSSALVYGFTHIIWKCLVEPLRRENICLGMTGVHILHSGGWKLLQAEAVDKPIFNTELARVFGCSTDRILDFYGLVENVGVIYPDCPEGNKHVPAFAEVIVRDPLTLEAVPPGRQGIIQVCSVLPTSFPGHLLLTEDIAEIQAYDGCRCGRRGTSFRFIGRAPKAEPRGCGNMERHRTRP